MWPGSRAYYKKTLEDDGHTLTMCVRCSEGVQFRRLIFVRRFWLQMNEVTLKLLQQQLSGGITICRGEGREIKEKNHAI